MTNKTSIPSAQISSHLQMHFIVVILSFTAILGKLISVSAVDLVWYRMLIAAVSILVFLLISRMPLRLPVRDLIRIVLIGIIVAAHWITFFGAIKLSNVSVTLGCLASVTLFTSILEPLLFRKRLNFVEVLIGLLIIAGLYMIFQFEIRFWKGITAAIISAFLAGLFTVLNRKQVEKHPAQVISFYEMLAGFLAVSIFLLFQKEKTAVLQPISVSDIIYLLILGIVCTAYAFAAVIHVMRKLTAYVVVLTINLEPVYGIILAFLIFGESELMTTGFYAGTVLIITAVLLYPIYHKKGTSDK